MAGTSHPEVWAVVPAAGGGARMRADRPKQYLRLLGHTILERSLERLGSALISLRADMLLLEGKPAEAISCMEKEFRLEIPEGHGPPTGPFNYLYLNFPLDQDVIPRAYEKMGNMDKAIEAYRKLIDFDPKGQDRRMHNPRYHYRLGNLYESKGQKDRAKAEYQKLLEIWKDADPGIPELVDAKTRLASLR